ncbi:hypothetical protein Tsubulata_002908 [Turnera subulata]|uniref:Bromo domain-containing protein n=1 Tax=Turnera subulata TaxID=218843 RepID=A0A9Q0JHT4_9ROSI|nr:hypothetical protein Tsubulata_002908 [Turnera subulata]
MASAVLANRNEPNWTQPQPRGGAKFMGKVPFSNPNPKFSKKRQFQQFQAPPAVLDVDESPGLTQSAASDDASSINRRPTNNDLARPAGYVTFNIATYTKKELAELKNRLVSELEQIRLLKSRIESADFQIRSNPPHKKHPTVASNGKKLSGNKRPFPTNFSTTKENTKRSNPEHAQLMKNCGQILSKLMKNKVAYIFNSPVDVEALKLHDYFDIIKHPMDLGTVKAKLGKNQYESPRDFAADVRLTFNNAMKYNPKGHEVYTFAEQFLSRFEELYRPVKDKVGEEEDREEVQEVLASSWDHNRVLDAGRPDKSEAKDEVVAKTVPIAQPMHQGGVDRELNGNANAHPARSASPVRAPPVKPVKQPKPKAKDPNKREMSLEEKHKLGVGLQSLPQEKMEQVVQIIRKRNGHLRQEGDEIELDIEAVDTETLWELDRFVTNYKKMVSKIKRQALMGINNVASTAASEGNNKDLSGNDRMDVATETKKPKKGDAGDEDVDIGDDMPMTSFPPVEIEKDNGHASSSSSSSSSSSDDSSSSSGIILIQEALQGVIPRMPIHDMLGV